MATSKQIAANRRNASKSTGPRTARGKTFTRLNALDHGLRAATIAWIDDHLKELTRLEVRFRATYQPQNREQEQLIDQMAEAEWNRIYWEHKEATLLARVGGDRVRWATLIDGFSRRQSRYQRAFWRAYARFTKSKGIKPPEA